VRTRFTDAFQNVDNVRVISGIENGKKKINATEMAGAVLAVLPACLTCVGVAGRSKAEVEDAERSRFRCRRFIEITRADGDGTLLPNFFRTEELEIERFDPARGVGIRGARFLAKSGHQINGHASVFKLERISRSRRKSAHCAAIIMLSMRAQKKLTPNIARVGQ
jgi:hypothetical protein